MRDLRNVRCGKRGGYVVKDDVVRLLHGGGMDGRKGW